MTTLNISSRAFVRLSELIELHASEFSSKKAIILGQEEIDYGQLHDSVLRIASALEQAKIARGSVIALVSNTNVSSLLVFLGVVTAGCVVAPIAPSGSVEQIEAMIEDCAAPIVFIDSFAKDRLSIKGVQVVELELLEDWINTWPENLDYVAPSVKSGEAFNIIYSSGTTGVPKGIVQTHGMRWRQIAGYAIAEFCDAVTLVATPLYSNTTLVSLLPTLAYGGTVVLMEKFDARTFLIEAERTFATHTMLVPIQYQRIMNLTDFDNFNLNSFRFKSCTSAPFSAELKRDVVNRWPGVLVEVYGMTEGGGACLLFANEFPEKLHTVGRPAPGHDIRVIDENGKECAKGVVGEVVGRSNIMMQGYHGRADTTEAALWTDSLGDIFIRHGDLGRFDEDGFLTLHGRSKDMIISGGFNIYPPDIESIIRQHPAVEDCAVIGVPSDIWGETPFAFFVLKSRVIDSLGLIEWVNAKVGKTQRLSGAEVIDELPLSAIGKVLKRALRERYSTRVISSKGV